MAEWRRHNSFYTRNTRDSTDIGLAIMMCPEKNEVCDSDSSSDENGNAKKKMDKEKKS